MPSASRMAAAVAFFQAVAAQQGDSGSLVLLQQQAQWDVKSWFNHLKGSKAKETVHQKAGVNDTLNESSNETAACVDWCADEEYKTMENGVEVVKNYSSWTMKCNWHRCAGCAECASLVAQENASQLSLSQGSAVLEETVNYGEKVPISEKGYQTIAALKDDNQMRAFIHRAAASEARYIKDIGALNGLVPFYSGTESVQSLEALRQELRRSPWVLETEGRRAPLTEFGYEKVASMMSKPDMVAFARRLADGELKVITDEGAFLSEVSKYNGQSGRNIEDLRRALTSAPWVKNKDAPADAVLAEQEAAPRKEHKKSRKGKGGKGLAPVM